ncbi:MAG: alpha/beta hydrolase [Actinomycetia bacterium]|nr:alpha/beta hydrolase [Actinomycetes bacterium]
MGVLAKGTVNANGVEFAYLSAGAEDAGRPLALCLHGFPDTAHGWRHLLPALADAGFRAIAPFQRGYAPTQIPADGCYQTGALGTDANALHDALGGNGDAVIIGHDWGATGTHAAAVLEPDRWRRVVTMAVPPGTAIALGLLTNLDQLQNSWYMFFFLHGLADVVVPANDLAFIDRLWAQWSPGYDAATDLPLVKAALRDPANLSAALGYYRATLGSGKRDARYDDAQNATQVVPPQPMLYLHGRQDGCIGVEVAQSAATSLPANVAVEIIENSGHFLHLQQPEIVNARILSFVS